MFGAASRRCRARARHWLRWTAALDSLAVAALRRTSWNSAISGNRGCGSRSSGSAATISPGASISRRQSAVVHKALDLGITLFDNADTYGDRRRRRGLSRPHPRRAAQGHRAGDQVRPADGCVGNEARRVAALYRRGVRGEPQAPADRLYRPLLAAYRGQAHADRGDAARDGRPRAPGQGALHRLLDA